MTDAPQMTKDQDGATPDYRYGWYTTAVLMVCYTFSYLDRQILNLMVGPIKADLGITDTQFALMTGGAFGLFYTIMGLPLGWAADNWSRKKLIAAGVGVWSLLTAFCGLAKTFPQLLMARIGVAIGEATLSPSAYSMLSDTFDKTRLPRAMSLYAIGIYIGAGTAMILGGTLVSEIQNYDSFHLPLVGELRPWQVVFIIVGLPGLLVSFWVYTLKEPPRRQRPEANLEAQGSAVGAIIAFIRQYPLMCVSLYLGSGVLAVLNNMDAWFPELFIRHFGWNPAETGRVNGIASLTVGPIGMLLAGWLSSRMIAKGQLDACLRLCAWSAVAMTIPAIAMPLMPTATLMAAMLFPFKFFGGFIPVLIPAAIQIIAPDKMRGQLGALFLFTVGIIGVTLGPLIPALIGDFILKDESQLHISLAIAASIVAPTAIVLLSIGLKQYRARLAELDNNEQSEQNTDIVKEQTHD